MRIEGIDYSPTGIEDIRSQLIILRDEALKENEFKWAVILSHAVVLLHHLRELKES